MNTKTSSSTGRLPRLLATLLAVLALAAGSCSGSADVQTGTDRTTTVPDTSTTSVSTTEVDEDSTTSAPSGSVSTGSDDDVANGGLPAAVWAVDGSTYDLVLVDVASGDVLETIPGWGVEASQQVEGGPQALQSTDAGPDRIWVADCCEPAVGSVFSVDPSRSVPVPESLRVDGISPTVSPDGALVATAILDIGVAVYDSNGGEVVSPERISEIVQVPGGGIATLRPVAWMDNETIAIVVSGDTRSVITFVSITNPVAPAAVDATIEVDGYVPDAARRGDGALLVVTNAADSSSAALIFDPASGERLAAFDLPADTNAADYDSTGTYLVTSSRSAIELSWFGAGRTGTIDVAAFGASWAPSGPSPDDDETAAVEIGVVTRDDIVEADLEGVGCWFHRNRDDGDPSPIFVDDYYGTLMVLDGEATVIRMKESPDFDIGQPIVGEDYEVRFVDIGERRRSSIESTEQPATLVLTPIDDESASQRVAGYMWCGV